MLGSSLASLGPAGHHVASYGSDALAGEALHGWSFDLFSLQSLGTG